MSLSWIKIGSRAAVVIIIYLLLSIPDTKYQYFNGKTVDEHKFSAITDKLVTNHISLILSYSDLEKSKHYDSLVILLNTKIIALKSEIIDSNSPIIDSMTYNFGLASAIAGVSSVNSQTILEHLWQWRQYLKEQSLFWNNNDDVQKLHSASTMSFVGLCEEFIVTNRKLIYTKLTDSPISLDPTSTLANIKSGDFLLSSYDISYSYLEQAKLIPQLTPSLGLILNKGDSSFYMSSTPKEGLHIDETSDFISRPFAKRLHLRLRDDLPELLSNPALPHQAATFVYNITEDLNIDYDFSLNQLNRNSLSETELLKFAYDGQNLNFINSYSPVDNTYNYSLSRLGIKREKQTTSSEIQFHSSIEIVGQQLSGEGIKIRNLEMASTITCLTTIDAKLMKSLKWKLPYYRLLKGYSSIIRLIGKTPVIPAGMAPETALVHDYIRDQNEKLLPLLVNKAAEYENENQYFPTYSMLREMAMIDLKTKLNK